MGLRARKQGYMEVPCGEQYKDGEKEKEQR